MALKIGRQKKIQIIDGQQVEVLTGDDEEEEEEEDEDDIMEEDEDALHTGADQKMMAVEGQDGQQYVVLEVIQLPENSGDAAASGGVSVKVEPKAQPQQVVKKETPKKKANNEKKQADLATAFGFDDEDEDD